MKKKKIVFGQTILPNAFSSNFLSFKVVVYMQDMEPFIVSSINQGQNMDSLSSIH